MHTNAPTKKKFLSVCTEQTQFVHLQEEICVNIERDTERKSILTIVLPGTVYSDNIT